MKFKKKPVEVDAIQFEEDQVEEVVEFIKSFQNNTDGFYISDNSVIVNTLEGSMNLTPGNWLIRGIEGEFYPCQDSVFVSSYDPIS